MSETVIRIFEGEPLPILARVERVLLTEEVPVGTGTATRRRYTLLVNDGRFWLSEAEKRAQPLLEQQTQGLPDCPEQPRDSEESGA